MPHQRSVELQSILEGLSLGSHLDAFVQNGYDNWDTVMDATDQDLETMGLSPRQRDVLRLEISKVQSSPCGPPTQSSSMSADGVSPPDGSQQAASQRPSGTQVRMRTSPPGKAPKRRYRRHPKPDANAPKRPKSAYVRFADQLRTQPQISGLSFVQIAKVVGEKWQQLDPNTKRTMEYQASRELDEYELNMDSYKKTAEYRKYQRYLDGFHAEQQQKSLDKSTKDATVSEPQDSPLAFSAVFGKVNFGQAASETSPDVYPTTSPGNFDVGSSMALVDNNESARALHVVKMAVLDITSHLSQIDDPALEVYDCNYLPDQILLDRALYIFCEGSVIYTSFSLDRAQDRVTRLRNVDGPKDPMDAAEILAIASAGSLCDADTFYKRHAKAYFTSCLKILATIDRPDPLRYMRAFLCLSLYCALEKSIVVRSLLGSAIEIGRLLLTGEQYTRLQPESQRYWQKVWRSVFFVESWLSYSLQYDSKICDEDIEITQDPLKEPTIEDELQDVAVRVSLLTLEISRDIRPLRRPSLATIRVHTEKLNAWHRDLPPTMHLAALNSEKSEQFTENQQRVLLLVHMLYLGVATLLNRELLASVHLSRLGYAPDIDAPESEIQGYYAYCLLASLQASRIAGILDMAGDHPNECWFATYETFNASSVLLFSASQKLLHGTHEGLDDDLSGLQNCMNLMGRCANAGNVAKRFDEVVRPMYHEVAQRSASKSQSPSGSRIKQESNSFSEIYDPDSLPLAERIVELLRDPFTFVQAAGADAASNVPAMTFANPHTNGQQIGTWWG
ncbi:hypothetical protein K402DRAFT_405946 [Aulographum hederae CBS 113979]|uniref:HMG box domain-containing protein n=1 Tax=Aulographum hederae CBS 113979 TaxID=1176131 RepID=A0A6G1GUZ5_9PEZI|nr:hypothetical protein K402DRAFT_405946 [Aulographum hederae CBS 113979]